MPKAKSDGKFKCSQCSFSGKSPHAVRVHVARAHGVKRAKRKAMARGAKAATRGRRCSICGKMMKNAHAMKIHMARMHKGPGTATSRSIPKRGVTPLQRNLMGLSLAELADLHEVCRTELKRRLTDIVG